MARAQLVGILGLALATACVSTEPKFDDSADTGFAGCCYFECSDGSSGYVAVYDDEECLDQADLNCVGNDLTTVAADYSDSPC